MKKSIKKLVLVGMMMLIVGCGNKSNSSNNQITCEIKETGAVVDISQNYTLDHKDDAITKIKHKKVYSFDNEETYKSFSGIINSANDSMKKLENGHIKFESKKAKNSYILELDINMTKITDEEIESLKINKSLSQLKTNLELQGYTCK